MNADMAVLVFGFLCGVFFVLWRNERKRRVAVEAQWHGHLRRAAQAQMDAQRSARGSNWVNELLGSVGGAAIAAISDDGRKAADKGASK